MRAVRESSKRTSTHGPPLENLGLGPGRASKSPRRRGFPAGCGPNAPPGPASPRPGRPDSTRAPATRPGNASRPSSPRRRPVRARGSGGPGRTPRRAPPAAAGTALRHLGRPAALTSALHERTGPVCPDTDGCPHEPLSERARMRRARTGLADGRMLVPDHLPCSVGGRSRARPGRRTVTRSAGRACGAAHGPGVPSPVRLACRRSALPPAEPVRLRWRMPAAAAADASRQ